MLTIGLYPNLFKKNLIKIAEGLINWFETRGYLVLLPKEVAESLYMPHLSTESNDIVRKIDIAITLGGDGTSKCSQTNGSFKNTYTWYKYGTCGILNRNRTFGFIH